LIKYLQLGIAVLFSNVQLSAMDQHIACGTSGGGTF